MATPALPRARVAKSVVYVRMFTVECKAAATGPGGKGQNTVRSKPLGWWKMALISRQALTQRRRFMRLRMMTANVPP